MESPEPVDDGLYLPHVRIWGEHKYRLIELYCNLFTRAMRPKWKTLVYIDLFSGAGLARISDTEKIVFGSPLIAMMLNVPFDQYILCERHLGRREALRERVLRWWPERDVCFLGGDVNTNVEKILNELPPPSKDATSLGLCVADPFKMSELAFSTIRRLSTRYFDFLVLIPTYMDANRNLGVYTKPKNRRIETFTGMPEWRQTWEDARRNGTSFDVFLTQLFGRSMVDLGYQNLDAAHTALIRSTPKNLRLYRLALYSRHSLGTKFWRAAQKYSNPQQSLF